MSILDPKFAFELIRTSIVVYMTKKGGKRKKEKKQSIDYNGQKTKWTCPYMHNSAEWSLASFFSTC